MSRVPLIDLAQIGYSLAAKKNVAESQDITQLITWLFNAPIATQRVFIVLIFAIFANFEVADLNSFSLL